MSDHPVSYVLTYHVDYEFTENIGVMRSEEEVLELYKKERAATRRRDRYGHYYVEVWQGTDLRTSYSLEGDGERVE